MAHIAAGGKEVCTESRHSNVGPGRCSASTKEIATLSATPPSESDELRPERPERSGIPSEGTVVEEEDLTKKDRPISGGLTPPEIGDVIARQREAVRGRIAVGLLLLIAFLVVASFVAVVVRAITVEEAKDLLAGTLVPLIGVFGAITGFYFVEAGR